MARMARLAGHGPRATDTPREFALNLAVAMDSVDGHIERIGEAYGARNYRSTPLSESERESLARGLGRTATAAVHMVHQTQAYRLEEQRMKYTVLETPMGWMGVVASEVGVRRLTIPLPTPDEAMSDIQHDLGGAELDNDYFIELDEKLQRLFLRGRRARGRCRPGPAPGPRIYARCLEGHPGNPSWGDAQLWRPGSGGGTAARGSGGGSGDGVQPRCGTDPVPSGHSQRPRAGWIRRPHRDEEAAPQTGGGRRGAGALLSTLHNS